MPKNLPRDLTSYDFLKTFAIVMMMVDHVGFYFSPDDAWWRVFGRLCVPVWFFLIGYARSRDLGPKMWIGVVILIISDIVSGQQFFPFNILATMILIRLSIDALMQRGMRVTSAFWAMNAALFLLALPLNMLFEYGTLGFILAMLGYLIRRRDDKEADVTDAQQVMLDKGIVKEYFAFALVGFVAIQYLTFGFGEPQLITLMVGTLLVMGTLLVFRPLTFPRITAAMPSPLVWLLQFTGRRTLEIYVGHLLLFKGLGMWLDPERFTLFDWTLFYSGF